MRINIGVSVPTDNIQPAFYEWFKSICEKYPYRTIEIRNGEIQVIRVRTPIDDIRSIKDLKYGKVISDSSGEFLERTFIPRYSRDRDEIILEQ